MKILGIDTSGLVASVALVEDDVLRAEFTTNDKKTHSQTLLPMLEQIRGMLGLELDSVDAIAIAAGPGSFTGLRIGSATAKGLGLALGKPLVEVPTLEGLAYNLWGTDKLVCPMMDARRNQVYTGLYEFVYQENKGSGDVPGCPGYELRVLTEQCAVEVSEMVEKCNRLGREVVFLGDGVPVYLEQIREGIRLPYSLAPASKPPAGGQRGRSGGGVCRPGKVGGGFGSPAHISAQKPGGERKGRGRWSYGNLGRRMWSPSVL